MDNFGWYLEMPGAQEKVINGMKMEKPTEVYISPAQVGQWFELGSYQPQQVMKYIYTNYNKVQTLSQGAEKWVLK
jgi:hypothetical protein